MKLRRVGPSAASAEGTAESSRNCKPRTSNSTKGSCPKHEGKRLIYPSTCKRLNFFKTQMDSKSSTGASTGSSIRISNSGFQCKLRPSNSSCQPCRRADTLPINSVESGTLNCKTWIPGNAWSQNSGCFNAPAPSIDSKAKYLTWVAAVWGNSSNFGHWNHRDLSSSAISCPCPSMPGRQAAKRQAQGVVAWHRRSAPCSREGPTSCQIAVNRAASLLSLNVGHFCLWKTISKLCFGLLNCYFDQFLGSSSHFSGWVCFNQKNKLNPQPETVAGFQTPTYVANRCQPRQDKARGLHTGSWSHPFVGRASVTRFWHCQWGKSTRFKNVCNI